MKKLIWIFLIFDSFCAFSQGNSSENWAVLGKIQYEKGQDEYGEIQIPKFGPEIQALQGEEIELSGYIIPFEGLFSPDHIIISAVPVASCFFCGGAGPESVAEIYLNENVKYSAGKVTVIGKLTLNNSDVDQMMYILKDAILKTD